MKPISKTQITSVSRLPALGTLALGAALTLGSPSALAQGDTCDAYWSPKDGTREFSTNDANPNTVCVDVNEDDVLDFVFVAGEQIGTGPDISTSIIEEPSFREVFVADYYSAMNPSVAKEADEMVGNRIQTIPLTVPTDANQSVLNSPSDYIGIAENLGYNATINANTMKNSFPAAILYAEGGDLAKGIGEFMPDSRGFLGLQVNLPCPPEVKNGCTPSVHYAWLEVEVKNGSLILGLIAGEFNPAAGGAITTPLAPISYVPPPRPVPVDGAAPWAALGLMLAGFAAVRRRRR